ncbi:MAG: hypothetical protein Harvfovirus18_12 [Harvfovirus sp.]|uniref:Uncharacterized protein n=1 Tax=Harvfovirus sp. TaxID=2487768 RepID=A0A3G5A3T8_9VIRU|nr:MAG: hypothetical protein Harvfovirus18_12 [Harvfovirus sp.]
MVNLNKAGQPWMPEDEDKMFAWLKEGKGYDYIAEQLGRSPLAIERRLADIAIKLNKKKKSVSEIMVLTGMNECEVNDAVKAWTGEEEELLLENVRRGMGLLQLSVEHKRSDQRIKSRLKLIAFQLYNEKKSIEEIVILTGLEPIEVELAIKRFAEIQKKIPPAETKVTPTNKLFMEMNKLLQQLINKQAQLEKILVQGK